MPSLNELRKELAREKTKRQLEVDMQNYDREKARISSQLFNLKHEKTIGRAKSIGKSIKNRIGNMASNFQGSRKKGKGVSGFLQRIANNQRL